MSVWRATWQTHSMPTLSLQRANDGLSVENAGLTQSLKEATDLAEETGLQLTSLKSAYEALNRRHGELAIEHQTLKASVATLAELERQAEGIREQIKELEALREPLILGPGGRYRGGLRCTGSMEPAITCLDEATWVADFQPEAIVVGATISFAPDCWGGDGAAHRVVDVKVEDGVYYYWPKGDNNSEADGCWVPHTDVLAYITEIHRGVRPENAELRQHVNSAKAAFDEALAAVEAAWATMEERGGSIEQSSTGTAAWASTHPIVRCLSLSTARRLPPGATLSLLGGSTP